MAGRKSISLGNKKPKGTHEFIFAALLLLVGSVVVSFLWMRSGEPRLSFSKAKMENVSQEPDAVYSEHDRVYLQKVLKDALAPAPKVKTR